MRRPRGLILRGAVLGAGALVVAAAGASGRLPAAASAEMHHAAVVIDTGEGTVKKFCVAFPEESISGGEALRRIEADAVFATYGGKGEAVCALCGVGCPSGNCFCDRSQYWAYHRAGPGGQAYQSSRAGVSSTSVRDGDVEGWRWGTGGAPPQATVGEICDVPEPPARSATTASTTSPPAAAPTSTTAPAAPTTSPPTTTATGRAAARPPPSALIPMGGGAGGAPNATTTSSTTSGEPDSFGPDPMAGPASPADPSADEARESADVRRLDPDRSEASASPLAAAVLVAVLGAVAVVFLRFRRANLRKAGEVR